MLPSEQELVDLIGSIYDAVGEAALWEKFLERLASVVRADSAALIMHRMGGESHAVAANWRIDPRATQLYKEYYGFLDIWAQRGRSRPNGYVCLANCLCPHQELTSTEFYNDFLSHYGVEHALFGFVEKNPSRVSSLSLFRDSHSDEFKVSDLQTISFLLPHVQQAFRLHVQFAELKTHTDGIEAALNVLALGVIFLGGEDNILLMNKRAEELLRSKDGLSLERGRLCAGIGAESARFQGMIAGAAQTSNGKGLGTGGTILISRMKGRPLSVIVAPLRNVEAGFGQRPLVVLFVSDPDRPVELPCDLLQRGYGLTAAEARLTMVLLEGHSLKEGADLCGVTRNTAKSQLQSIFSKTHVGRQAELVKLLLTSGGVLRNIPQ